MPIKIKLIPDGPIQLSVEGEELSVTTADPGQAIPVSKPLYLCRCGESKNKPYCDGAHAASGYTDGNRCDRDQLKDFPGSEATVHFNRAICSGAGECVRGLPAVFQSNTEDWIHPDEATVEDVINTVKKCPSGALTYTLAGKTELSQGDEISFRIVPNGPYAVTGPVQCDAPAWSRNASKTQFTLCRCGKSSNNPFCDYSHGEQGWKDSE